MTDSERIAQLERDVASLQAANNTAHVEIHELRDKAIPALWREVRRLDRRTYPMAKLGGEEPSNAEAVTKALLAPDDIPSGDPCP